MACNWVVMRSSHCPYLVRIESNADFLSRFYGWLEDQPHPDCVTTIRANINYLHNFDSIRHMLHAAFKSTTGLQSNIRLDQSNI